MKQQPIPPNQSELPIRESMNESSQDPFLANLFQRLKASDAHEPTVPRIMRVKGKLKGIKKLGAGGLGVVYQYYDRRLQRSVALKVARHQALHSPARLNRFLRERKITAKLQHPAIPPVYQSGRLPDERPYYVMRLIEGIRFSDYLNQLSQERNIEQTQSDLEFNKIIDLFCSLCDAVQYAHSNHVVHRDIKPENVMVEPDGTVFLVDWGLARHLDDDKPDSFLDDDIRDENEKMGLCLTQDGHQIGTPHWMSPEQASGDPHSHGTHTDIYGLGGLLYLILAHQPPHQKLLESDRSLTEQLHEIATLDAPHPLQANQNANKELASICCKAMNLDHQLRYPSAAELRDDVRRWQRREIVLAHSTHYSKMERAELFAARHRRGIIFSLATLFLMFSGVTWAAVEVSNAADQTEIALEEQRRTNQQLLSSLELFSDAVMQDDVLSVPQLRGLRNRLLTDLAAQYKIWSLQSDGTPEELSRAARGTIRLAQIERETGNMIRSIESGNRAIELAESAVNSCKPEKQTDYRLILLQAIRSQVSLVLITGNVDQAHDLVQRGYQELEHMKNSLSKEQRLEEESKLKHLQMSVSYNQANRVPSIEARKQWLAKSLQNAQEAVELQRKVIPLNGTISQLTNLVTALNAEALAFHKLFRYQEAIRSYEEALDILQARKKEMRAPEAQKQLKQVQIMISFNAVMTYRAMGNLKQARIASRQGITVCKELKQAYPLVIRYSQELARGYGNLAEVELADYLKTLNPEILETMIVTFRSAAEEYLYLSKQYPDRKGYQGAAAIQYLRLSEALHWAGQDNAALTEFKRCLSLNPQPEKLEPTHGPNAIAVILGYCLLIHDEKPDDIKGHAAAKRLPEVFKVVGDMLENTTTSYVELFAQDEAVLRMKKIPSISQAIATAEETIKRKAAKKN